jgi:Tfp pilus assembly protein PilZ
MADREGMESSIAALVFSADRESTQILERALQQLGIKAQVCLAAQDVREALQRRDFDLLLLDFDEAEAGSALDAWSGQGPNSSRAVTGFARNFQTMTQEQRKCAQFYIQKPLSPGLVNKTLSVVRDTVLKKRRSAYRCTVNIKAQAGLSATAAAKVEKLFAVTMLDISSGGACLKTDQPMPVGSTIRIVFLLPVTADAVHATGKVVWVDRCGITGVKFTLIPPLEKSQMEDWLNERDPNATRVTLVDNPNEVREGPPRAYRC